MSENSVKNQQLDPSSSPAAGGEIPLITFISTSVDTDYSVGNYDDALDEVPSEGAPTGFIPAVYNKLLADGAVPVGEHPDPNNYPKHQIVRVASVCSIGTWLKSFLFKDGGRVGSNQVRIQIVGHSHSGQLSLAASWPSSRKLERFASPFYVLDSSPMALDELYPVMGRVAEVSLTGCYIAQRLTDGNPINGRTLLFSLSEMWHCKASGATLAVNAVDFHNGWYTGPVISWTWDHGLDTATRDRSDAKQSQSLEGEGLPQVRSVRVQGMTLDDEQSCKQFSPYFDSRLAKGSRPNLAGDELLVELACDRDGKPEVIKGALVGNGQFLRVVRGDEVTYYANRARSEQTIAAEEPSPMQRFIRRLTTSS